MFSREQLFQDLFSVLLEDREMNSWASETCDNCVSHVIHVSEWCHCSVMHELLYLDI